MNEFIMIHTQIIILKDLNYRLEISNISNTRIYKYSGLTLKFKIILLSI